MKEESPTQFAFGNTLPVNDVKADFDIVDENRHLVDQNGAVSETAHRRVEMLELWKQQGLDAVNEQFGNISIGRLFAWQKMLKDAHGDPAVLNPKNIESELDLERDFAVIVEKFLPESSYQTNYKHPETNREYIVININVIKDVLKDRLTFKGERVSRRKIIDYLIQKYKSQKVLLADQVQNGNFEARPLFYIPASSAAATNSIEITDDNSHIGIWDIGNTRMYQADGDDRYPTEDGSPLTIYEARFAYKLFHPKYGAARRNAADGVLLVKNPQHNPEDPTSKKRVPITRELLRLYNIDVRHGSEGNRQTIDGMVEMLPNLIKQQELTSQDFFRQHTLDSKGNFNANFAPKEVPANGTVMLNGVRQYVGRRFEGCTVYPFTAEKALVFREEDGRRVLVAAFTIVDKNNASAIDERDDGRSVPRANVDKTNVLDIKYAAKVSQNTSSFEDSLGNQRQVELENKVTEAVMFLIETAMQAEELVKNELADVGSDTIDDIIKSVRKDLMSQAEKAIAVATATKDAVSLKEKMEAFAYDARGYIAILQSIGIERMLHEPLDVVKSTELTTQQRDQMRKLLQANYAVAYPNEEDIEFRKSVASSLEAAFKKLDTDFYILNNGDKIISFNRFDTVVDSKTGRRVLYFGSFNADPKYRGVGSIMLEHTIQAKLNECDAMQANCDPKSEISKKYIEDGFIATQTETKAGKFSFEIWRSKDSSEQLQTKKMSQEELVAIAGRTMEAGADYWVREVETNDPFHELDEGLGYLMTRYFTYQGKTYVAFEINTTLSKQFAAPAEK